MNRPSAHKSSVAGYLTIRVPDYTIDRLLVEIAKRLANSDDAIRHAVTLAREAEAGGVTDHTLQAFRVSLYQIGGTYISLNDAEARAFADELWDTLRDPETDEAAEVDRIVSAAANVPSYSFTTTTNTSNGGANS